MKGKVETSWIGPKVEPSSQTEGRAETTQAKGRT